MTASVAPPFIEMDISVPLGVNDADSHSLASVIIPVPVPVPAPAAAAAAVPLHAAAAPAETPLPAAAHGSSPRATVAVSTTEADPSGGRSTRKTREDQLVRGGRSGDVYLSGHVRTRQGRLEPCAVSAGRPTIACTRARVRVSFRRTHADPVGARVQNCNKVKALL